MLNHVRLVGHAYFCLSSYINKLSLAIEGIEGHVTRRVMGPRFVVVGPVAG